MCEKCENDCGIEEISREDAINVIAEEIEDGECIHCNLELLFNIAYNMGQKDLAEESRDYYQDILEED